jgi:hypothetical protein
VDKAARAAELNQLRDREQAAKEQLSVARKRIAQLERELEQERPLQEERSRPDFDLTPEDWREMAAKGVMKYRLPCSTADSVLDELGLAPEDGEVVRQAVEHSATRLRSALLPLCAAALGDQMALVEAMSTDVCRNIILSTTSARSESQQLSAQRVASAMAGDAPRPGDKDSITERTFLVLAEESTRFQEELAEAFGPEEAYRLVFSDKLCFSTSTFNFHNPRKAGTARDELRRPRLDSPAAKPE